LLPWQSRGDTHPLPSLHTQVSELALKQVQRLGAGDAALKQQIAVVGTDSANEKGLSVRAMRP
jgi:hypothetical protein